MATAIVVWVLISSYSGDAKGTVQVYRLDVATGMLQRVGGAGEIANATYLCVHPRLPIVYAVSEVGNYQGQPSGAVAAYALDVATGQLRLLNQVSSQGALPCHISIHPSGRLLAAASYTGGCLTVLPVLPDGQVGEASDVHRYTGTGGDPKRQPQSHAHSAVFGPGGRDLFVQDLGTDKIMQYRVDLANGKAVPHDPPFVATPPASGPRHLVFHPTGRWAYCINELDNTLLALDYDVAKGTLSLAQVLTSLPADCTGKSYGADIHVSPEGAWLYASNRGHDSLAICRIDAATGRLTAAGWASTVGKWPRGFALVPGTELVLVANQNTHDIIAFRRDPATGQLQPTGARQEQHKPVCIAFYPPAP
jgi:6-phosphogluconolactonase